MKAYLINLDRSPERLALFTQQARNSGIAFTRLPAVDGRNLDAAKLAAAVSPTYEFHPINAAEAGLFMSHRMAWSSFLESSEAFAAVFEDDVVLATETGNVLDAIEATASHADIIKLETTLRKVVLRSEGTSLGMGFNLQGLLSWHGGTAGYAISRNCARKLLAMTAPLRDPVDQLLFNPLSSVSSQLSILQINPAVCIQKERLDKDADQRIFGTTIDRRKSRGILFHYGPIADLRRIWKRLRERLRRQRLASIPGNSFQRVPFAARNTHAD